MIGLVALIILGSVALLSAFLTARRSAWINKIAMLTLVIGFVSFGLIAWTGYLGGQIRHTEVSSTTNQVPVQNEKEEDD